MRKYGYQFFEHFYNYLDKNEAEEQVQNIERFKEELIILALRTLSDYEKIYKLMEPRFGVMNTSNFMKFFFRLYWSMHQSVSFKNLKKYQDQFHMALKDLHGTQ